MKSLFKSAASILVALMFIILASCSEDDPKVLGLDKSARYGNLKFTFEGTRPDGVPFKVTRNYKYITGFGPVGSSTHVIGDDEGTTTHQFRATRLYDPFDNSPRSANVTINAIEESGELVLTQSTFTASSSLTFDDMTALSLIIYWGPLQPEDITYSYNEETGKFKAKFETVVLAEDNTTDHDLHVTGEVSVKLYKPLN